MENDKIKRIIQLREAGQVQRCHCIPHYGSYDIAQHSYHMAMLLMQLHPAPSKWLYEAILLHDVLERWTGDSPAMIKLFFPEIRTSIKKSEEWLKVKVGIVEPSLNEEERDWIKALDNIEFFLWCEDQIGMGSQVAALKKEETLRCLNELIPAMPEPCRKFMEAWKWRRTFDNPLEE